jgi:hypothetical protein
MDIFTLHEGELEVHFHAFLLSALGAMTCEFYAPTALFPVKEPSVSVGGFQSRSGRREEDLCPSKKNRTPF